jgi:peptidoglycan/LPS O-acetylase OafA/YrhL
MYFPQLDGLRTFAVLLVFLHHWSLPESGLGIIGVQLFFVISGFLITGILLGLRELIEKGQSSLSHSLRQFYIRRALRIFPLYYACLILFVILDRFEIRETAPWYFLYAANIRFFLLGTFEGPLSHFWTLAVEEQFYLIWPLLVLLIPRGGIKPLLWVLILCAPITRISISLAVGDHFASTHTLLPANFDTLGLGALGACWRAEGFDRIVVQRITRLLLPLCLIEMVAARVVPEGRVFFTAVDSSAVAVVSLWLVLKAGAGFRGAFGTVLSNGLVRFLGRLSYGLYVWHMFAPAFLRNYSSLPVFPRSGMAE